MNLDWYFEHVNTRWVHIYYFSMCWL